MDSLLFSVAKGQKNWVVTMGQEGVLNPGAVLVVGEKIAMVASPTEVDTYITQNGLHPNRVNTNGRIVLPGLIDAHTHMSQQFLPGLYERARVQKKMKIPGWARILMPFESMRTEDEIKMSVLAACINGVKFGTTFFSEHGGHYPDTMAKAMRQVGMRGLITLSTADMNETGLPIPQKMIVSTEEALARNLAVVKRYDGLVTGCFSLRQITVCTAELIAQTYRLAENYGRPVQTHSNEGHYETDFAQRVEGLRPVEYLEKIGGLSSQTIAAHSVLISEHEVELFAKYGVGVASCPRGNFAMLGQGQLPLMRRLGVKIGLGSDGAAGGTTDLFQVARMMLLGTATHFGAPHGERSVFTPKEALAMATIGGAAVVGQVDKIGSLEPGKFADIIVVRPDLGALPVVDPITTLVNGCSGSDVETVVINGRVVMKDRVFATVNEEEIYDWVFNRVPQIQDEFLASLS